MLGFLTSSARFPAGYCFYAAPDVVGSSLALQGQPKDYIHGGIFLQMRDLYFRRLSINSFARGSVSKKAYLC